MAKKTGKPKLRPSFRSPLDIMDDYERQIAEETRRKFGVDDEAFVTDPILGPVSEKFRRRALAEFYGGRNSSPATGKQQLQRRQKEKLFYLPSLEDFIATKRPARAIRERLPRNSLKLIPKFTLNRVTWRCRLRRFALGLTPNVRSEQHRPAASNAEQRATTN